MDRQTRILVHVGRLMSMIQNAFNPNKTTVFYTDLDYHCRGGCIFPAICNGKDIPSDTATGI